MAEERHDASSIFIAPPLPAQKDSARRATSQEPAEGAREVREDRGAEERHRAPSMFNVPPFPARKAG
eukprot:13354432-Alexandrium_andersonii.AAC.1